MICSSSTASSTSSRRTPTTRAPKLERARDEAAAEFLARAGPNAAREANHEIAEWLEDITLAPEPEAIDWWVKTYRDMGAITDPWFAVATAERRWGERIADP